MADRIGTEVASASGAPRSRELSELALMFLRLGLTAFGGPAAHLAMMEDAVVRRRGWLTHEEFLDSLGATNLLPGPTSTEMAIWIGWHRARWAGLLVGGICFILPAALLVTALASAYVRFGTLPAATGLLYGIKPVIIAVLVQVLWRLAGSVFKKKKWLAIPAVLALLLSLLKIDVLVILLGTGLVMAALECLERRRSGTEGALAALPLAAATQSGMAGACGTVPFSLGALFLFFLKVGSVLFGSGYLLLAVLRADLVEQWGWLTERQLLDAIAVGQITPGPVSTTATFIGYMLAGFTGAVLATIGIFLPSFVFVAILGGLLPRARRSRTAGAFLDGVNAASLALLAVVTYDLGQAAIIDVVTAGLAVTSGIVLGAVVSIRRG